MDIEQTLASDLHIQKWQVSAAVSLLDEGATIPFIARYRKEVTGSLNDEILRELGERLSQLRNLEEKRAQIIRTITEQEAMTPALLKQLEEARTMVALEDLYRPFRPKRRTRAMIAKELGLEALAKLLLEQNYHGSFEVLAAEFCGKQNEVIDPEKAISGAEDILAEQFSDDAACRTEIRNETIREGLLASSAKEEQKESVYEMYYNFSEPLKKAAGHRILALNRGEKEKILSVRIDAPEEQILKDMERRFIRKKDHDSVSYLKETIQDAYHRLISPAIEREIRNALTEYAEDGAIRVFGKNLEQLLMQPPIRNQVVLGWDPGYRNGCKLAVVDATGKVLTTDVVYPTQPTNERKIADAKRKVTELIHKYHITLVSVGNGTAGRESEQIIADIIKPIPWKISYVVTNEAGASVYSASPLGAEEFPDFDVNVRSAVSIARRLQDSLAELVKIEPKAIGVGQYQHDMNQKKLDETLGGVVEDCVNKVGVDLNTASAPLLSYISGINKTLAKNIVAWREENGAFTDRRQLKKVPKLGPKAFEQCAGFLRIPEGVNPLDNTAVHPESYPAVKELLNLRKIKPEQLKSGPVLIPESDIPALAKKLEIGEPTLRDICAELAKPGRDPRDTMQGPMLRSDVMELSDLKVGMHLNGTIRNIVDFGAFVDIGVHQDGLVHISRMSKRYIKHPLDVVKVGDQVEVEVISVDVKKKRIGLSMVFDS